MKKKVGIITYQYAYNYGAILQLAAMQKVLTNLDCETEAINYLPADSERLPIWKGWGLTKGDLLNNIKKRLIMLNHGSKTRERFDLFRKNHLSISTPCYTNEDISELTKKYNAVITGSDQVWHFTNPAPYFLDWDFEYKGKRISYAPSCGTDKQPIKKFNDVKKWIQQMDFISVRDEVSRDIIFKLCKTKPEIVSDPTLLADLNGLQNPIEIPYQEYIFMYVLGDEINGGHEGLINLIKSKHSNLPVVALVASAHKPQRYKFADHIVWDAGPAEWLYLLSKSSFVYTDSFHCTLFSLKEKKNFISYYKESRRSPRFLDLKERYSLNQHIVSSVNEAAEKKSWERPNFKVIDKLIRSHVEKSLVYLKKALFTEKSIDD